MSLPSARRLLSSHLLHREENILMCLAELTVVICMLSMCW